MAASPTLSHSHSIRKSGVLVLSGYGVRVQVNAGHLVTNDGIADERRIIRLPRVGHGLRRLVIIGSDGFVTLEALRWISDVGAAFMMLNRSGKVIVVTGPVSPSDAKLRRAQALALGNGAALKISEELISRKLVGQELLAQDMLRDTATADAIAQFRDQLPGAESIEVVRLIEAQAARRYWQSWSNVPIRWPRRDESRVPEHWRRFGSRISPLTHSPRLASNPPNSLLNFLYSILENESRLSAAAMGLDPGIGCLHMDTPNRDSLACDVMEAVRPQVDAYVLDWIKSEPLRREWFREERDGNCRLMGSFAAWLCETAPTWGRAVAPIAEWISRTLWSARRHRPARQALPATRLTQAHRRQVSNYASSLPTPPRPPTICRDCGAQVGPDQRYCSSCAITARTTALVKAARIGRTAAQSSEARASRADTQRLHHAARRKWQAHGKADGLDEKAYVERLQPHLRKITAAVIASALRVSEPYASDIRSGRRVPHPRHWQTLARLAGGLGSD
jgi:CRISPR-associated endonuclease Cas1